MKTLLIDNYDSFTYNLFQLLAEVNGEEPLVVRNDAASWGELAALGCDNVVLSPGPGRPERGGDFGVCAAAIEAADVPLLGVCLGHQGIALACGARIGAAPEPVHGRLSAVRHAGDPLFAGIPERFEAARYHSLRVEEPLPAPLRPLAWSEDGVLMALRHAERPLWGVQFHPESVGTGHGRRLLANFRDLTGERRGSVRRGEGRGAPASASPRLELRVRRLDREVDAEAAFAELYGGSANAFWLDSSGGPPGSCRFSFMGDDGGPLGAMVLYDVETGELRVERRGAAPELRRESIFDYLGAELERLRVEPPAGLPIDFPCGFAGWLGYELKAECGGDAAHASPLPDAALILAGRMLAFDHERGETHLLALAEPGGEAEAEAWLEATAARLEALPPPPPAAPPGAPAEPRLARPLDRYLEEIEECRRALAAGETYEVCLTNRLLLDAAPDPLHLYRALRRANPAPHAAFVRCGGQAVLSSSPERFLRIDRDRTVEARPIKGTCRRDPDPDEDARLAAALAADEKNRAENLTIADLLRNDLGRVCEPGSVEVPALIALESFATVHQLVTTVRGRLRPGVGAAECVRACFPPGSMTGAPKLRTMRIIDRLEGAARGPYSGAIGYFGLGGSCDLSVAIRTIVLDGEGASIGAGGAIVTLSDPDAEVEEMLLKAAAPLAAFGAAAEPATAGSGSRPRSPA